MGSGCGVGVSVPVCLHRVRTLGIHGALPPLIRTPSRRDFTCTSHIWPERDMRNGHYDLRKAVSDRMLYCTRQAPNSIFASLVANPHEILFHFVQLSDGSLERNISPSATPGLL